MAEKENLVEELFKGSVLPPMTKPKPRPKPFMPVSKDIFHTPMVLIDNDSGKPMCNHETLSELSKIEKTLNIVSVVGTFRSGKSFLLNKLSLIDTGEGFKTGHTTRRVTKGIWVLCRPHPKQEDQVLVLLDTEGIDDPEAVQILDGSVFILTTLLSSTLVYNTTGNFDRAAIHKFEFLAGFKTSIIVAGTDMDDSILDFFFPTFILSLRDVTLEVTKESDQFLEDCLVLRRGITDSIRNYNHPRQLIRRYYKRRKCFIFKKPTKTKNLRDLMKIPESELKEEFQETLNAFRDYVFSCPPKTLKCGRGINGRMFSTLLVSYVNSINDGQPPNIQAAMQTMADVENTHAIEKAAAFYNKEMKQKLAVHNAPNDSGLVVFHNDSMNAALAILKNELVFDDKQIYEEQAMSLIKKHLKTFKDSVDRNSKAICEQRLQQLNLRIVRKMKTRAYCHPSGYDEYMTDIEWIVKQYRKEKKYLGTKARVSLQEFLDGKESEEETVYQWVAEAQEQQSDTVTKSMRLKRLSSQIEKMDDGNDEDLNSKDDQEKIEDDINKNIESMQKNGRKNIESQYLEMLKMKIDELERVKEEVSDENPLYGQLRQETDYWQDLWKKATWNRPQYNEIYSERKESDEVEPLKCPEAVYQPNERVTGGKKKRECLIQ